VVVVTEMKESKYLLNNARNNVTTEMVVADLLIVKKLSFAEHALKSHQQLELLGYQGLNAI